MGITREASRCSCPLPGAASKIPPLRRDQFPCPSRKAFYNDMHRKPATLTVDGLQIVTEAYLPDGHGPFPVVCLCHGIPHGSRDANDGGYPLLAERCCREGFATMIFNFRGTGESEGNLDMPGWARDLTVVLDYAVSLPGVDRGRVNLLGFSAGAAVSIYVAARDRRVTAVASCASPADFRILPNMDRAREFINHLRSIYAIRDPDFPPSASSWIDGFSEISPLKWVGCIAPRPLLIVHGEQDDLVPVADAYRLHEKAKEPKELCIIPGAGHRLRRDPRAMDIALDWLKKANNIRSGMPPASLHP
ncbi:MAG: alpha/beta fold hydrolase [Chloroflexi bacterium]|nr:alpha/beta fold hydrolase [Chloroflexota bacterium]